MKKYKILKKRGNRFFAPWAPHCYGELGDFLNRKQVCQGFDPDTTDRFGKGFYVFDIDGLLHVGVWEPGATVFEVEVGGDSVIYSKYEQRFSEQKFVRIIPEPELQELVKECSDKLNFDYYHMLFPIEPFAIEPPKKSSKKYTNLKKKWVQARTSILPLIECSVKNSIKSLVKGSIERSIKCSPRGSQLVGLDLDLIFYSVLTTKLDFVRRSIRSQAPNSELNSISEYAKEAIWAYIGSLFPYLPEYKHFKAVANLWRSGLFPIIGDKFDMLLSKNGIEW